MRSERRVTQSIKSGIVFIKKPVSEEKENGKCLFVFVFICVIEETGML